MPNELWRLLLFGGLCASHPDRTIRSFRTGKTAQLLAFVACRHPSPQPRERLIELLWPDAEPEDGRNSLRVAVSSLRRQLEPAGTPVGSVLGGDRNTLGLSAERVSVDVVDFRAALHAAQQAEEREARITHLLAAEALYRAELLPSFYADWVLEERRDCEEAMTSALRRLATDLVATGDLERALTTAQRLAAFDPLDENAHATLIRILLSLNRPAEARDRYRTLERALRVHLNTAPLPETQALVAGLPRIWGSGFGDRGSGIGRKEVGAVDRGSGIGDRGSERPALPPTFTRFIGRERELASLQELFCGPFKESAPPQTPNASPEGRSRLTPDSLLVTLTGFGGVGKTRLAIETARAIAPHIQGLVTFVPLVGVTDAEQVPHTVARALGLGTATAASLWDRLGAVLNGRPSLLILDNLEHLGEHGAEAVRLLRLHLPETHLLVTSRVLLQLEGEIEFVVEPLAAPSAPDSPEALLRFPAVRLFLDRAQAARQDFQLTTGYAADVAAICAQLDGLPLALELAAGWARALSPAQMHARLRGTLDLLVSHRRDLPERHRSMRAAVEASCVLLPEADYQLFCWLSVFRGSFCQEAAEAVCGPTATLDALDRLRVSSLLVAAREGSDLRWSMLAILRAFAAERVSVEAHADLQRRHALWALELVEHAAPRLCGPEQIAWSGRLEAERLNLLEAIDGCATSGELTSELRITVALYRFWLLRGPFREGVERLRAALHRPGKADDAVRAAALEAAGQLIMRDGDSAQAEQWLHESLALRRSAGDLQGTASTLHGLAWLANESGAYASAGQLYQEALSLRRRIGDRYGEAASLNGLAVMAYTTGNLEQSQQWHREVLTISRELGDVAGVAASLNNLADCLQEDLPSAEALYAESLALQLELGNKNGAAVALFNLAECARKRGDPNRSWELHVDGLKLKRDLGRRGGIAFSLETLAGLAVDRQDLRRAAQLLGAAAALREAIGMPAPEPHRTAVSNWQERCRAGLGKAFDAVTMAGGALTLADAIQLALLSAKPL